MGNVTVCKTEKQLKSALSNKASTIRIENSDLINKVKLIKALKPATWASIATGLVVVIGAAIVAAHPPEPGDVAIPMVKGTIRFGGGTVAAVTATLIIAKIGFAAAAALITLGVTFGGIDLLNSLYHDYEITESGSNYLVLQKE